MPLNRLALAVDLGISEVDVAIADATKSTSAGDFRADFWEMMSDSGNLVDTWELPGAADGAAVDTADMCDGADGGVGPSAMRKIIRSKGFVWVANQVCCSVLLWVAVGAISCFQGLRLGR